MKKCKKSLALILSMLMLISVFQVGASAYFPYINEGVAGDAISSEYQITSVNVTDLYGDAVTELAKDEGALVSCKVKAVDGNGQVQLIATAYNSAGKMVAVKRSEVVTLGKNAEDVGVYLTVNEAATSFKAFLWDGSANLIPLTKSADSASETVNVIDVLLDGVSVKDNLNDNTYAVSIPASQFDCPDIQVITDNPAARVEVTSTASFPLTKQWDTEAGTATVTATVTLNGVEKAKYIFNVTQAVPEIIDATFYQWTDNTTTKAITETITEFTAENIVLKQIKEADYSNLKYTQSQLSSKTPAETPVKADGQYFVTKDLTNTWYGLIDIAPEFLNGALLQQKVRGADSLRSYSMYSMNKKGVKNTEQAVIQLTDTIYIDDVLYGTSGEITPYSYSFKLNRSAMVYVFNKPDGTSTADKETVANEAGFENAGFTINNDLVLKYSNLNGANEPAECNDYWYEKHVVVTGNDEVMVKVPIGVNPMLVIIKFDEGQSKKKETILAEAKYQYVGKEAEATSTVYLHNALPKDANMSIEKTTSKSDFTYAVYPWVDRPLWLIYDVNEDMVGAEILKIPGNYGSDTNLRIDNIEFSLTESADVYFVINGAASTEASHWLEIKPEWFNNGWRVVKTGEGPIGNFFVDDSGKASGPASALDPMNNAPLTIKKHFDVDSSNTKVLLDNLTEFDESTKLNNRQMLVIIKKTDR